MRIPLFAGLLLLAGTAPAMAQVQKQPNPDVENVADTRADAPTRDGRIVPLCSATITDECMNPSQAPRGYGRARSGEHQRGTAAHGPRGGEHRATHGKGGKRGKAHKHRRPRHGAAAPGTRRPSPAAARPAQTAPKPAPKRN